MHWAGAGVEERTESDAEVENNASPKRLVGYVSYWIRAQRTTEVIALTKGLRVKLTPTIGLTGILR